jgi:Alkylmercury lyase/Helix-turn-helix domain of alkylmercury lyase
MDDSELTGLGQLLAERICGTNEAFCFQLLRLLGQGQPVSAAQMGAALGMSEIAVTETFQRMSDIERDEMGQVVGWGLSLQPTRHQFRINGHTLYTWCALDVLTYPILLEQTAQAGGLYRARAYSHGAGTGFAECGCRDWGAALRTGPPPDAPANSIATAVDIRARSGRADCPIWLRANVRGHLAVQRG